LQIADFHWCAPEKAEVRKLAGTPNQQEKNTTPFAYFAQTLVGTVLASLGTMLGYDQYESPPRRSAEGLTTAPALVVVGVFLAHAGAIFRYRRLRKRSNSGAARIPAIF
jgi:hypothetical protein